MLFFVELYFVACYDSYQLRTAGVWGLNSVRRDFLALFGQLQKWARVNLCQKKSGVLFVLGELLELGLQNAAGAYMKEEPMLKEILCVKLSGR